MRRKPFSTIIEEAKLQKPLALIIEDDTHLAAILAEALQALGFATEVAVDGKQALSLLGKAVPWIVMLDLTLPEISDTHSLRHTGMGILQFLHDDPRLTNTRVIISTGDARAAEYLGDQADLVLVKPITSEQLQTLATRLTSIDRHRIFTLGSLR